MVRPDGGGSGPAPVLKMTDEAVRTVRQRFDGLSELCEGIVEDLPDGYTQVTEGCGSFFAQIDPGITAFTASWQVTFALSSDQAKAISTNINQMSIDLSGLDRTLAGG
ncbi:hypothetical protein [Nocardioides antri]|uniref:WXG100 family type VII secretion target n=1 Tax=Nocardioides antri TaxID=2607659 RepID=A0A5B1M443_9ACTN|nr:hypothetical protein [Nocardioides antri]KAA1427198.1 hypothetical protein F0U47_06750 [Nocardioides antri]